MWAAWVIIVVAIGKCRPAASVAKAPIFLALLNTRWWRAGGATKACAGLQGLRNSPCQLPLPVVTGCLLAVPVGTDCLLAVPVGTDCLLAVGKFRVPWRPDCPKG